MTRSYALAQELFPTCVRGLVDSDGLTLGRFMELVEDYGDARVAER
jgi:hypothetical protein